MLATAARRLAAMHRARCWALLFLSAAAVGCGGSRNTFAIDNVSTAPSSRVPQASPTAPAGVTAVPSADDRKAILTTVLSGLTPPASRAPAAGRQVDGLAAVAGWAVASWTEGEMGGQTLLRRDDIGTWVKVTEGGGWLGRRGLTAQGVPDPVAVSLLDTLDPNWRRLEP
jgi:hypothetical protein